MYNRLYRINEHWVDNVDMMTTIPYNGGTITRHANNDWSAEFDGVALGSHPTRADAEFVIDDHRLCLVDQGLLDVTPPAATAIGPITGDKLAEMWRRSPYGMSRFLMRLTPAQLGAQAILLCRWREERGKPADPSRVIEIFHKLIAEEQQFVKAG